MKLGEICEDADISIPGVKACCDPLEKPNSGFNNIFCDGPPVCCPDGTWSCGDDVVETNPDGSVEPTTAQCIINEVSFAVPIDRDDILSTECEIDTDCESNDPNSEFSELGIHPTCETSCDFIQTTCINVNIPRCVCKTGYIRDTFEGICVLDGECPVIGCEDRDCTGNGRDLVCFEDERGVGRCIDEDLGCVFGAIQCNAGQQCVPDNGLGVAGCVDECTDENSEFKPCGTACPPKCGDPDNVICTLQCVPECQCKDGYVLDAPDGTCIPEDECEDSQCPPAQINPAECTFEGSCCYGEETCCGETHPSYCCSCIEGQTACFFTDACLGASLPGGCESGCVPIVVLCADGTTVEPDPDNDCIIPECPEVEPGCPAEMPNPGDICAFEGDCDYGIESCCGDTFPSIICSCVDGVTQCLHTDSCLGVGIGGCPGILYCCTYDNDSDNV